MRSADRFHLCTAHHTRAERLQVAWSRPFSGAVLWTLLPILLAVPAQGQSVEAFLSVDSASVGERFYLSLVVQHGILTTPHFPEVATAPFGDLEVLARSDVSTRYLGAGSPGTRIDSVAYEVTTFALDTAFVPAIPVLLSADSDTATFATAAFIVPIRSVVPSDAEGPRDLAPIVPFARPLWPWILLGLAALLLGALLYHLRRRRRNVPTKTAHPAPTVPAVPPYEEAMERLKRLERANLYEADAIKPFYIELSDLLRTYLERRLGVPAHETTTRELLASLRQEAPRQGVPPTVPEQVRHVLNLADLAKFADVRPAPEAGREALQETRETLRTVEAALRPAIPEPAVLSDHEA